MKRYRVGIVGLGRIASLYEKDAKARRCYPALTHAGSYSRHPRTEIASACDTNVERLHEFGKTWKIAALYSDAATMLSEQALDILSVCTQPESHREIIEHAAGKVALIFCEKPMGRNLREAEEIAALCDRRGTQLAVNLYRLFDPSHQDIGQRIKRGDIGKIQRVNCFYGKGLRNIGSHMISLLIDYFGPVTSARAIAFRSNGDAAELSADFMLQFTAGFPAVLQSCDFKNYRIFEMDILGETGRITLDQEGFGFHFFRAAPNRAESGAKELIPSATRLRSTVGKALYYAVDNIVRTLDGKTRLMSTGREYLETERIIEEVLNSSEKMKPIYEPA